MLDESNFTITYFNSGEPRVVFKNNIHVDALEVIKWDSIKHPNLMVPILMADAISTHTRVHFLKPLIASYLPFSRHDRNFAVGEYAHIDPALNVLGRYFSRIKTHALHCENRWGNFIENVLINEDSVGSQNKLIIYPDASAYKHYSRDSRKPYYFLEKKRNLADVVISSLQEDAIRAACAVNNYEEILLLDDICDGGRTLIESAKYIRNNINNSTPIRACVYHAFPTFIKNNLWEYVDRLYVINADSYNSLIGLSDIPSNFLHKIEDDLC
jgi:phosphoribosylpyrophosphate synthetase